MKGQIKPTREQSFIFRQKITRKLFLLPHDKIRCDPIHPVHRRGRKEGVIQAINHGADFSLQKGGEPETQFAKFSYKVKSAPSSKRAKGMLQHQSAMISVMSIPIFLWDKKLAST